jgi:hypothetical protein
MARGRWDGGSVVTSSRLCKCMPLASRGAHFHLPRRGIPPLGHEIRGDGSPVDSAHPYITFKEKGGVTGPMVGSTHITLTQRGRQTPPCWWSSATAATRRCLWARARSSSVRRGEAGEGTGGARNIRRRFLARPSNASPARVSSLSARACRDPAINQQRVRMQAACPHSPVWWCVPGGGMAPR